MTRKSPTQRFRDLITAFDEAAQAYAFMGAAHLEDHVTITANYINARRNLEKAIGKAAGLDFFAPNDETRAALAEVQRLREFARS